MKHSPTFPSASILAIPREDGETVSGVLVARDCGYLAVQVQFHGDPLPGLEVQFFVPNDNGERGDSIGEKVLTNLHGIARAFRVVPAGLYVCAVEGQDDLLVPTGLQLDDPYPVVLPVGRSYVDMHDGLEFKGRGDGNDSDDGAVVGDADETNKRNEGSVGS